MHIVVYLTMCDCEQTIYAGNSLLRLNSTTPLSGTLKRDKNIVPLNECPS